jgi:uncharacterized protein
MSSQNIAIVNRIYEAFQARDFAAFFSTLSPEIHITQCPELPFGGIFQGHDEARSFFEGVAKYVDSYVTIERIIDATSRVAVIGRTYGTAKATGRNFDVPILHLWGFRDGLAVRLEIALDVATMQAALGV